MNWKRLVVLACLFSCIEIAFAQPVKWTSIAPGVWKAAIGKPDLYNLLSASGAKPNIAGLAKLGEAPFPLSINDIAGSVNDGKTVLRFPLDEQ